MAFAVNTEDQSTRITLSEGSLVEPYRKKTVTSSFPFIKPGLKVEPLQDLVKIIKQIEKVYHQGFKKCVAGDKDNLSLNESKYNIRELAAELDRLVQIKKFSLMSGNMKNKGSQEEQQYYILQWAEELENLQRKQTDTSSQDERPQTFSEKSISDTEMKLKQTKKHLSRLTWKLKDMKQNSVCPKGECRETLRDLHKQWRQGESSILPVMDWMMKTVLQPESSEDFVPREWVKNKQKSKNIVGLRISNAVWHWITKSKAVIILDPNTANPDLLISKNGKSVRAKNYGEHWKDFQRNHTKFDGWTCVQAKVGYNTGSHYWEVDIRKKCEWRLGVVKESAPRNGFVTMNTKTGFWNLRLQLGTLIALTEPVTKLNMPTPHKIGVYLDIEEGQVSFYDAEKRRHIYTFNTEFSGTETIYPMFGTIETDRELVIS
ncbi:SPRY_PRY_C-I_1 domain-containing protein [Myxocyprinus asiaticus]|uniref:SPRY_PRY_C-I_1 domain-containing protein n=1 Tax=Myxocyprinus asiaticus TaxID=70543 RepID=UPI002222DCE9|nr:SPRY_PRY_C-I_1 domain-containing protein [Myxocyprinus asiaticus]